MSHIDCLIVSIPKVSPVSPPLAPAVLKAIGLEHGFKVNALDLNIRLFNYIDNPKHWFEADTFHNKGSFEEFVQKHNVVQFLKEQIDLILKMKPRLIGISLFSLVQNKYFLELFCRLVKEVSPEQKIVVGGLTGFDDFIGRLTEERLIDYYVIGEGEETFLALLKGNQNLPGIYSIDNIGKEAARPVRAIHGNLAPNYDDFDFSVYYDGWGGGNGTKMSYITGSRGCVRRCKFCDVPFESPGYRYRTGQNLAEEMITLYEKYSIETFVFSDNLVNGSLKQLREMCLALIDFYKKKNLENSFTLRGHLICRTPEEMPAEFYDMLWTAGFRTFFIGVESGSEEVRDHMRKQFSNEDLYFTLAQLHRTGIRCTLLLIVGYITETEKDFEETLQLIRYCKKQGYLEGQYGQRTIGTINLGSTLEILDHSELKGESELMKVSKDQNGDWFYGENTMKARLDRYFRAEALLQEYGLYDNINSNSYASRNENLRRRYNELLAKEKSVISLLTKMNPWLLFQKRRQGRPS